MKFIIKKINDYYTLIFENMDGEIEIGDHMDVSYLDIKENLGKWVNHKCGPKGLIVKNSPCEDFKKGGFFWKESHLNTYKLKRIFKDLKDKKVEKRND